MAKIELFLEKADARYAPGQTLGKPAESGRFYIADARYTAGEAVGGKVVLSLEKQLKYRSVQVKLSGIESTITGSGRHRNTDRNLLFENTVVLKEESGKNKGALSPGVYELPFRIALPQELPPTYTGAHASICYRIDAWVDVPSWFDISDGRYILVAQRKAEKGNPGINFHSGTLNTQKPSFSVILKGSVFEAGQNVQGAITVLNPQNSKIKKATVKLYAVEQAGTRWANAATTVFEAGSELEDTAAGVPREFSIPIPAAAPPTYASKLSGISWYIEARLDLPLRFDVKARSTITVLAAP